MGKIKKTNPRRKPVSQADLYKAQDQAVHLAMAIFLSVLKDRFGFDNDAIVDVWNASDKLSEEIKEGRVSMKDLVETLNSEYNISLL